MFSYNLDEDLRLALPEIGQADELAAVVRANLEHLKPWMAWAADDYAIEHAREWIRRTLEEFVRDGRFQALIIFRGRIIGAIGFHALDTANRSAAIGYWIDKSHEGKGIITRATRVLIDYLFDTMQLNRVEIRCNTANVRSRSIPERLGFKLEGTLREAELINGKFGDWAVYGLLRNELSQRITDNG